MVAVARSRRSLTEREDLPPFAADVLEGLGAVPKRIPAKYFYDIHGSELFERITTLPEYYPTRCEIEALTAHAKQIAAVIPEGSALIEFGSGSNRKARILLAAASPKLAAYVPVDINGGMLQEEAAERTARGGLIPAQCGEDSRAEGAADHRRRSDQGTRNSECGL